MRDDRRPAPGAAHEFLLGAEGLTRPILFSDAAEVAESLVAVTRGWNWQRAAAGDDAAELAAIRIGWAGDGYAVDSSWLEAPVTGLSAVAAACSAACDIGLAHIEAQDAGVGLHCGAVEIGGRLVVLAGARRAGKSTLVTRLGAEALRVFTDDILPLAPEAAGAPERGVALGIAPRLRLPLPRRATAAFRAHVDAHVVASDDRYGYVMTPSVAPRGETAPIGVILLLDRLPRMRGPARLRAATRADALRLIALRNLTPDHDPDALLGRLERLVEGADVLWLEYADLEDAVRLISTAFATGAAPLRPAPPRRVRKGSGEPAAPARTGAATDVLWRTRPGVGTRDVEGELFICDRAERALLHLNPVGAAIWDLLADGGASELEAAGALAAAYPAVDPARIAGDVVTLFDDLRRAGLIEAAGEVRGPHI